MKKLAIGTSLSAFLLMSTSAFGQLLYSEDYNTDATANWNDNASILSFSEANFFFDYGTLAGIPEAPNSKVGDTDTRGMKLIANQISGLDTFGGFSVSPTGLDLGTGDYSLTFDWWANSIGGFPIGGSGSTQASTFGVLTSGTTPNEFGELSVDGVMFASVGDGNTADDWRAYSSEVNFSYQDDLDPLGVEPDLTVSNGQPVYFAPDEDPGEFSSNQRNSANAYYSQFGSVEPPAAQTALFSQQTGTTNIGSPAFQWIEVEITKIGNVVTWYADSLPIAVVDTTNFATGTPLATSLPTAGTNISFGHHDVNTAASSDPDATDLLFTLIDNIEVNVLSAAIDGDLNVDGFVGVDDLNIVLLNWNQTVTPGNLGTGDPSGDGFVGVDDLNVVLVNWNNGTPPPGAAAIPEPASLALLGLGGVAMLRRRR